jgi:hypothetical protein
MLDTCWARSSRCVGESHCVEVAFVGDAVLLRNSTRPLRVLKFTADEWDVFLQTVRRDAWAL